MKKPVKPLSKPNVKPKAISEPQKVSGPSDFTAILFFLAYLFIDFLPYAKRVEIIMPQFLYLAVLNIITGIYIYKNPEIVSAKLVGIVKKSYFFKAYMAFMLLCFLSVFSAKNTSLVIHDLAELFVVLGMLVNLLLLIYHKKHLFYRLAFLVGLSAFFQAMVLLISAQTHTGHDGILMLIMKNAINGNTGNINIFSASILSKLPFVFLCIIHFSDWKRWFLMFTLFLATFCIFLISARAALISTLSIFLGMVIFIAIQNRLNKTGLIRIACIILPLIISFSIANLFFLNEKKVQRYEGTALSLQTVTNQNDGSVQARLFYWKNAIRLIKEKPFFGVGLGNWRIASIPLEKPTNGIVSLHTHNDFLEFSAETGLLNGLIYLSIFIALLVLNLKLLLGNKHEKQKEMAMLALLLLIVFGVDSLFNFPFFRPTMQLSFCFCVGIGFLNFAESKPEEERDVKINGLGLLPLLCILPLYVVYQSDKTSNLEYRIRLDHVDTNPLRKLSGDKILAEQPFYPDVLSSSEPFVEYAGIYYKYEKNYAKATQYLDIANQINPYFGRANFYKHVMAYQRGLPDSAYFYLKAAYYNAPGDLSNFKQITQMASKYKDTLEILKLYTESQAAHKNSTAWTATLQALRGSGYSNDGINQFFKLGLIEFPKDSSVTKNFSQYQVVKYILKGQKQYALNHKESALASYFKALDLDPRNVYALQNIGLYYYNIKQYEKAIPYLLKTINQPGMTDGNSEFFLGISYVSLSDRNNGCKYLNLAKARDFAQAQAFLNQYCK